MRTRRYAERTPGLAGVVYCDSSFLLDYFAHSRKGALQLDPMSAARAKAAFEFFVWGRLNGLEFVSSLLALEECYHKVLFTPVRSAAGGRPWKEFRTSDAVNFNKAVNLGRTALGVFQGFLLGSAITIRPIGSKDVAAVARLAQYIRLLLNRFAVDTADAFHYAIMRKWRLDAAASSDRDWDQFPYGILITLI